MFMIIKHIAYITCLVTNDAWHAYLVIGVYKIHHRAVEISYFTEQAILWLAAAVMARTGLVPFNGANNNEVSYHGYGRGRGP